jgi:hypothetical protein
MTRTNEMHLTTLSILSSHGALLTFRFFSEKVRIAFLVFELLELKQKNKKNKRLT